MEPADATAPAAGQGPGFSALASLVARHIRALTSDYALLAVLDARRAALALAWLLSAGLAVAVLAVTAWLALVTGAVVWLLGSGASWTAALGVAALSNILGAVALGLWMRGFFRELPFAATLRQLKGEAPTPEGES